MQFLQQRPGARLTLSSSLVGRLAPDVGFDRVQRSESNRS
jgi:hypothetical protein